MIEVVGDLWTYPAQARVITTNGYVKANGRAVMGRGVAKQAMTKFKDIDIILGEMISWRGNIVALIGIPPMTDVPLYSFPVKHNWWEKADLELIEQSASMLSISCKAFESVVLPRPGCGNGQLQWADVKPVIEKWLDDDKYRVIELPGRA